MVDRSREDLAQRGLQADVVQADVLQWSPAAPVDAVYEQTCLCALHPDHWTAYAAQLQAWVKPDDLAQAQANLLKGVKEAFDAEGIVFPYPHQVAMPDDSPLAKKAATRAGPKRPAARARSIPGHLHHHHHRPLNRAQVIGVVRVGH